MRLRSLSLIVIGSMVIAVASQAQTFTELATLSYYGLNQLSSLVQGTDGNFYGTSSAGGTTGYGTVFKVSPSGALTTVYNFCQQPNCADGYSSGAPMVLATDGNLYGSAGGGAYNLGAIFKITPEGTYTILHSFNGTDGSFPSGLVQATGGFLYGATSEGGTNSNGTVFSITADGAVTTLYSFCSANCADGWGPLGPIQGEDGNLYGTTVGGGNYSGCYGGCGGVFKLTTSGEFTSLHSFDLTDGAEPFAPVVQARNGSFYGTTFHGGIGSAYGYGSLYRVSSGGIFKDAYDFQFWNGGPTSGLTLASDGNLYAGTYGNEGGGYIYEFVLTPPVTIKTLYTWYQCCGGGTVPFQATDGRFYGTYYINDGYTGAIYRLDTGLGPLVAFVQPTGKSGATAQILGQGLTGTTTVTFNGVAATKFTVVSDTYMTAVVPSGATTGPVVVTTPGGALTSNVSFRIIN